ncbi:hypothetical protein ACN47E_004286 [Coniothyrium glycines]
MGTQGDRYIADSLAGASAEQGSWLLGPVLSLTTDLPSKQRQLLCLDRLEHLFGAIASGTHDARCLCAPAAALLTRRRSCPHTAAPAIAPPERRLALHAEHCTPRTPIAMP